MTPVGLWCNARWLQPGMTVLEDGQPDRTIETITVAAAGDRVRLDYTDGSDSGWLPAWRAITVAAPPAPTSDGPHQWVCPCHPANDNEPAIMLIDNHPHCLRCGWSQARQQSVEGRWLGWCRQLGLPDDVGRYAARNWPTAGTIPPPVRPVRAVRLVEAALAVCVAVLLIVLGAAAVAVFL